MTGLTGCYERQDVVIMARVEESAGATTLRQKGHFMIPRRLRT
ncbi:hypothetical protein SEA_IBANTIK_56 [Streptomyces phage Ibantik]|uniref:Uncharacterized protein n=1 Tax=Streptomyces phage Ibantik TaxID=2182397 RepID=A0A2U8UNX6_9CAUD|nr:hypothetical protein QEH36_gp056 [Streptomyces phage Ibantik]AWN05280.1 hypothetical protein SEA_IBANTIK_56 [Streptomyces phage Ibantik]